MRRRPPRLATMPPARGAASGSRHAVELASGHRSLSRIPSMRHVARSLTFALGFAGVLLATHATAALRLPRPSPAASTHQTIGVTDIDIAYSRPGVKNRVIWGGLVPLDKAWR